MTACLDVKMSGQGLVYTNVFCLETNDACFNMIFL